MITLDAGKLTVGRVYYTSWCVEHGQVPEGRTGQRSTGGRRLDDLLTRGGPEHDRDLGSGWPGQGVSVVRGEGAEAEERLRRADDEERRPR